MVALQSTVEIFTFLYYQNRLVYEWGGKSWRNIVKVANQVLQFISDVMTMLTRLFVVTFRIWRVGKVLFSQVSVSRGVPQSQVLSQVTGPRPFLGGYSSSRFFPRSLVRSSLRMQGYPRTGYPWARGQGSGLPTSQVRMGGIPGWGPPSHVRLEYPLGRTGLRHPPVRSGWSNPPPPRSRRRTFLFLFWSYPYRPVWRCVRVWRYVSVIQTCLRMCVSPRICWCAVGWRDGCSPVASCGYSSGMLGTTAAATARSSASPPRGNYHRPCYKQNERFKGYFKYSCNVNSCLMRTRFS